MLLVTERELMVAAPDVSSVASEAVPVMVGVSMVGEERLSIFCVEAMAWKLLLVWVDI